MIEEHRSAFAYDWRARFGLPLDALDDGRMSIVEGCLLLRALLLDPSSHAAAAVAGWDHPWSWEAMVAADAYDVLVAVNSDPKKSSPRPYPRPWRVADGELVGSAGGRSPEEIQAVLASLRPQRDDREVTDGG